MTKIYLGIRTLWLAFLLAGLPSVPQAAEPADREAFKAAYARYQQAIEAKDGEAAAAAAKEALDLGPSVLKDDSPSMAALYVNYGMALVDTRQYEQAIPPLKKGIKRLEKVLGKSNESLIEPLWALADAYRGNKADNDEAIPHLRRILSLVENTKGEDSFLFAEINQQLGEALYFSTYEQRRAPAHFKKAYETYQRLYNRPAFRTGVAAFWLGKAALLRRKYKSAEQRFGEALNFFEKTVPPGHALQLMAHTHLIQILEERGDSDLADAHCQAISLLRPQVGVDGHKPLYKKVPEYPRNAASRGAEGWVLLEFTVTARGTVTNAKVVESDGLKSFELAALEAAERFRYAPAVKDGKLIDTHGVTNLITFEMAD